MQDNVTRINLDKSRIKLNIILISIVLALPVYMVISPESFVSTLFRNKNLIFIAGCVGVLYLILILISKIIILIRVKEAIEITKEYLIDNTSYESIGKIKWADILLLNTNKAYNGNKYIEVKINNLDKYYNNFNLLKKILLFMKNWNYKSTIILNSRNININIEGLEQLLQENFEKYKRGEFDDIGEG